MAFDDAFANCQPDTCSLEFVAFVQSLKDNKNSLCKQRVNPDSVVSDANQVTIFTCFKVNVNVRWFNATVLYCIVDQVDKQPFEQRWDAMNNGVAAVNRDFGFGLFDP